MQKNKQRENLLKGSIKFQIVNGFILFGFLMIWIVVMTFIRTIGIRLGWIPYFIVLFLVFWPYYLIIKKRKEKLKNNN